LFTNIKEKYLKVFRIKIEDLSIILLSTGWKALVSGVEKLFHNEMMSNDVFEEIDYEVDDIDIDPVCFILFW